MAGHTTGIFEILVAQVEQNAAYRTFPASQGYIDTYPRLSKLKCQRL